MKNINTNTRRIVEAALFIAITFIIGRLEFRILPQGGSISMVALPLAIYAVRNGIGWGILTGAAYGTITIMWSGSLYHPLSGLLDFIIPPAAMGLAGLFSGDHRVYLGILLGCSVGLLSNILSGILIFSHFMPDVFLGLPMGNIFFYSFIYNVTHVVPSMLLSMFVLTLIKRPLKRFIFGQDLPERTISET